MNSTIASVLFASLLFACSANTEPTSSNEGEKSSAVTGGSTPAPAPAPSPSCTPIAGSNGSANPASVYCSALGYTLNGEDCAFPDGTKCEEWAFYRGECGQAHSFCNLHGGSVKNTTEDMGGWTASYALCTMPDGKSCHDDAFAQSCDCK